jgi:ABC-type lipoprotein export system ATPase subunit
MLLVDGLKKTFVVPEGAREGGAPEGVPVVDVGRFELGAGEQVALLGSSGSGKTTLLHLLAGILKADAGRIEYTVEGRVTELTGLSEMGRDHFRGQHIGYIFQTHHLLPGLTAMENVLMGMSFTGRRADRSWAGHLLERVGLRERVAYKPGKMSVGQQQRVAVARALANRPGLVLADEPTGALDALSAQRTLELIRELSLEVNAGLILVTHDLGIAGQLGRRVELSELNCAAVVRSGSGGNGGSSGNREGVL